MPRALPAILTLALLAGCGHDPAAAPAPEGGDRPAPAPRPIASLAPAPGGDQALVAALRQQFQTCRAVEAEVRSYSEGHWKAGKQVSELRKATYRTHMVWEKPNKIRAEILETDNFLVGGASMATQDGQHIRVRGAGILGLFPLTLDVHDDLLASNRNHRFSAMLPELMIGRLLGPQVVFRPTGTPGHYELLGMKHLDSEIDREEVQLDGAGLRRITMFKGQHVLVDYDFLTFKWNPKVDESKFSI